MGLQNIFTSIKVAAKSLKREIRLHAHQVGMDSWSRTEAVLCSSDSLICSEWGYCACSLISGLKDGAAALNRELLAADLKKTCFRVTRMRWVNGSLYNQLKIWMYYLTSMSFWLLEVYPWHNQSELAEIVIWHYLASLLPCFVKANLVFITYMRLSIKKLD